MPVLSQQGQLTSFIFTLAIAAVVISYDIWAYFYWGGEATLSGTWKLIFAAFPKTWGLFLISLGILIGHLWPAR